MSLTVRTLSPLSQHIYETLCEEKKPLRPLWKKVVHGSALTGGFVLSVLGPLPNLLVALNLDNRTLAVLSSIGVINYIGLNFRSIADMISKIMEDSLPIDEPHCKVKDTIVKITIVGIACGLGPLARLPSAAIPLFVLKDISMLERGFLAGATMAGRTGTQIYGLYLAMRGGYAMLENLSCCSKKLSCCSTKRDDAEEIKNNLLTCIDLAHQLHKII